MVKVKPESVNLWRNDNLQKDKSKPDPESYQADIERIQKTMHEGVSFLGPNDDDDEDDD